MDAGSNLVEGLFSVFGDIHLESAFNEYALGNGLVNEVVFGNKNAAGDRGGGFGGFDSGIAVSVCGCCPRG